jgi:hypothetical protein
MFTVHHHKQNSDSDMERSAMKMTIKQFDRNSMRLLAGAFSLIALLAVAQSAFAQQNVPALGGINMFSASTAIAAPANNQVATPAGTQQNAKLPPSPAGQEEATASPAKPGDEGIKVHGHWVLQVKNPDGTLGERREFNNSLVPGGAQPGGDQLLAALISGNISVADPAVAFLAAQPTGSTDASSYCVSETDLGIPAACYLLSTAQNGLFTTFFPNIATGLTTTLSLSPHPQWVLSGNYTVPTGLTTIALVQTLYMSCISDTVLTHGAPVAGGSTGRTSSVAANACVIPSSGTSPGTSNVSLIGTFTSTTVTSGGIPDPMGVTPGQIVVVTVTISFS